MIRLRKYSEMSPTQRAQAFCEITGRKLKAQNKTTVFTADYEGFSWKCHPRAEVNKTVKDFFEGNIEPVLAIECWNCSQPARDLSRLQISKHQTVNGDKLIEVLFTCQNCGSENGLFLHNYHVPFYLLWKEAL